MDNLKTYRYGSYTMHIRRAPSYTLYPSSLPRHRRSRILRRRK